MSSSSGSGSYAPSEDPTSSTNASPFDDSEHLDVATLRGVTRSGRPFGPRSTISTPEAMPMIGIGSMSPGSDVSHEVISISSSPTSSISWGDPASPALMSSRANPLPAFGRPAGTMVRAELKTPWLAWDPNPGITSTVAAAPLSTATHTSTHEATPGLDLDWASVPGSQTPGTSLKDDALAKILEGALPSSPAPRRKARSAAPILSRLKRKTPPDERDKLDWVSPKRKISKEGKEITRVEEIATDLANEDILLETEAAEHLKSVSPKDNMNRAATNGAYVETEVTEEQGSGYLKGKLPLGAPSLIVLGSDGLQEPTTTIETGKQAPNSADEDAKSDESTCSPEEQTVATEEESVIIGRAGEHGHATTPSNPSPEEVWKKAVADNSLPGIVQSITTVSVFALVYWGMFIANATNVAPSPGTEVKGRCYHEHCRRVPRKFRSVDQ